MHEGFKHFLIPVLPYTLLYKYRPHGGSDGASTRRVIEVLLIRNPDHAKKYEKEERESRRLHGNNVSCDDSPGGATHSQTSEQKVKLKLGKGKKQPTNAVDTTFKARCTSLDVPEILRARLIGSPA